VPMLVPRITSSATSEQEPSAVAWSCARVAGGRLTAGNSLRFWGRSVLKMLSVTWYTFVSF